MQVDGVGEVNVDSDGEEDILVVQARERERTAQDVSSALLGAILTSFMRAVAKDAAAFAAPPEVRSPNPILSAPNAHPDPLPSTRRGLAWKG